jgi:hypothetical protein
MDDWIKIDENIRLANYLWTNKTLNITQGTIKDNNTYCYLTERYPVTKGKYHYCDSGTI